MKDVRDWFNGSKDYAGGVALYNKYGADATMKRLFAEPESPFKYQLLKDELESFLSVNSGEFPEFPILPPAIPILPTNPVPEISKPTVESGAWPVAFDEVTSALKMQWQPLFSEMINLCNRVGDVAKEGLRDANKKEEAGRMALRILELDDQCEKIYQQREHYLQYGTLPVKQTDPVEIALDSKLWPTRLANHQRYVRDYKAKLAKSPDNTQIAATLKKHQWAVNKYKELMHIQ
ncbi:hypothetical protein ACTJIJ_19830 [Niabella sp. 22666]|uniref:hypothetical protein n=1 Tax=Niabella sp. 22666 TaxID=3453954 RepID=UPI003F84A422